MQFRTKSRVHGRQHVLREGVRSDGTDKESSAQLRMRDDDRCRCECPGPWCTPPGFAAPRFPLRVRVGNFRARDRGYSSLRGRYASRYGTESSSSGPGSVTVGFAPRGRSTSTRRGREPMKPSAVDRKSQTDRGGRLRRFIRAQGRPSMGQGVVGDLASMPTRTRVAGTLRGPCTTSSRRAR